MTPAANSTTTNARSSLDNPTTIQAKPPNAPNRRLSGYMFAAVRTIPTK